MFRGSKIDGLKRRSKAWLMFIVIGLAVLFFGNYLDDMSPGMGESIISLGMIWIGISVLFLILNLFILRAEKKKLEKEKQIEQ